jgi:guanosine-diphosphatase
MACISSHSRRCSRTLLSYFYDHIDPLLLLPSASDPSASPSSPHLLMVSSLADLATDVYLGRASWEKCWAADQVVMKELADRPEYCLNLADMHALPVGIVGVN